MLVDAKANRVWNQDQAIRYEQSRHGPDGRIFLDPHVEGFIAGISPADYVLDVGAGAGPFSIEVAHRTGARVVGLDNSDAMVDRAETAFQKEGFSDRQVDIFRADAGRLPFGDNSFQAVASINVGCNLDVLTLGNHLKEMGRVVTPEGKILFTAPINLGKVFTDGSQNVWEDLLSAVDSAQLDLSKGEPEQLVMQRHLGDIASIHRATFVVVDGNIRLVVQQPENLHRLRRVATNERSITQGMSIWRKVPGLVVPNIYHSSDAYEASLDGAGLTIIERHTDSFATNEDRGDYARNVGVRLGQEYVGQGPFAVYVLNKK